jgi:hypothetical protein
VQVHHDEEVANRIGPESCAAAREGISEALTISTPHPAGRPGAPQGWRPAASVEPGRDADRDVRRFHLTVPLRLDRHVELEPVVARIWEELSHIGGQPARARHRTNKTK